MVYLAIFFVLIASFLPAQSTDNPALKPIIGNFSPRNFAEGEITRAELNLIVQAAVRTPSAGNRQPWHFTVVQSQDLVRRIIPQATRGNILVIVSASVATNTAVILDCALATQSIYLAAQALGLGSRIYTGSINTINTNFKTELGLTGEAIALIRIGRLPPDVDATSSASPRNETGRMVTYK